MLRRFRNDPPPPATIYDGERSGAHLRADALASLITGQAPCDRPDTMLLVIADYDICARQLRGLRYDDGQPVAADQIARVCAEAQILPAVFSADGDPLWLGRAARRASLGQRIVLAARDGGCVNCAAPQTPPSPTTSDGTAGADPQTSTTSPCCATAATTSSTTTTGTSAPTGTTGNTCNLPTPRRRPPSRQLPRPSATPSSQPEAWPTVAGCARSDRGFQAARQRILLTLSGG